MDEEPEPLVTLPDMAKRHELSTSMVNQLRKALWHHAVRVGNKNYYPETVVEAAIRRRTPNRGAARGMAFAVGSFPPSPDLVWCPCGKSFVDDAALGRHVDRDHEGITPAQVPERPRHTLHWSEVMEAQRAATWRNYETTNRPDVASV